MSSIIKKAVYKKAAKILDKQPFPKCPDMTSCHALELACEYFTKFWEKKRQYKKMSVVSRMSFLEELKNEMAKLFSTSGRYEEYYFESHGYINETNIAELREERNMRLFALRFMARNYGKRVGK